MVHLNTFILHRIAFIFLFQAQEKQSTNVTSSPAPKKNISNKVAMFSNAPQEESPSRSPEKQSTNVTSSPAPKKNISTKVAMFSNAPQEESPSRSPEKQVIPKQLDKSKTAFLTQTAQEESPSKTIEKTNKLDQSKLNFLQQSNETNNTNESEKPAPKPLEQNKIAQIEAQKVESQIEKKIVSNQVGKTSLVMG